MIVPGTIVATLSTGEAIGLASVIIAGLGLIVATTSVWVSVRNERKRSQPILIAHEARGRHFHESPTVTAWVVDAYLTNDGGGPAFNVRFGVEFHGVRHPHKLRPEDPDAGNVQRVVQSGERRPPDGSWPILIDSTSMYGSPGDPDPGRIYWARYENAEGKTWETRNPRDRTSELDIRRVWGPRFRQWREKRARGSAGQRGEEWERQVLAELLAGTDDRPEDP